MHAANRCRPGPWGRAGCYNCCWTSVMAAGGGGAATLLLGAVLLCSSSTSSSSTVRKAAAAARTFYVGCGPSDSDTHNGLATTMAWRTPVSSAQPLHGGETHLELFSKRRDSLQHRVNRESLAAGDTVLFARGCSWHAVFLAGQAGNATHGPVTFGAFGDASLPKPQLLGSVNGGDPTDWRLLPAGGSLPAHVRVVHRAARIH